MQHNIYVTGVSWKPINSASEALSNLRQGALSRTTAATAMNSQSSRSHAVFTINIQQKRFVKQEVYLLLLLSYIIRMYKILLEMLKQKVNF